MKTAAARQSGFDEPERMALYGRARRVLEQEKLRREAVRDMARYMRKATKAEIALSRRIAGEAAE